MSGAVGHTRAAFERVAARELFVRSHLLAWQPDVVLDDGESALLRIPASAPGVDPMLVGVGDVGQVAALLRAHAARLGPIRFAILPYGLLEAHPDAVRVTSGLEPIGPWAWMYCRTAPPPQPGEQHVGPVDDAAEVDALLDAANPTTHARGSAALAWWGYRREGRLLGACGIRIPPAPPGSAEARTEGIELSGLGTHPDARRQGVGAAMMAAITRWGVERFGLVHYGVWLDNEPAFRIYRRLGYTTGLLVQSYARPASPAGAVSPPG